ncbi:MAG: tol-pal system protein YbgF, partial [Alphaproteobacteria bacterium]
MKKVLLFGLLCVALPAMAQSTRSFENLQEKVERLEQDLILMQQRVYQAGTKTAQGADSSLKNINIDTTDELLTKVAAQEQALQELTDKVEKITFEIKTLSERLTKMKADTDMRFQLSESAAATTTVTVGGTSQDPKNAPAVKAKTDKEQYEDAYLLLREGKHIEAEKAFLAFIENNPKSDWAGNANYWLGETYYARGQYEQAAPVFAQGFTTYKNHSKAPDNLLKLGMTMNKLGKKQEACTAFSALPDEFPQADNSL